MNKCKKCGNYVSDYEIEESEVDCDKSGCPYNSNGGNFVVSAVIGAVTGSALLGGLIGGDIIGGVIGDLLDGDLMD